MSKSTRTGRAEFLSQAVREITKREASLILRQPAAELEKAMSWRQPVAKFTGGDPGSNSLEFEGLKNEAGRNSFFLSAKKWVGLTSATGLIAIAGC